MFQKKTMSMLFCALWLGACGISEEPVVDVQMEGQSVAVSDIESYFVAAIDRQVLTVGLRLDDGTYLGFGLDPEQSVGLQPAEGDTFFALKDDARFSGACSMYVSSIYPVLAVSVSDCQLRTDSRSLNIAFEMRQKTPSRTLPLADISTVMPEFGPSASYAIDFVNQSWAGDADNGAQEYAQCDTNICFATCDEHRDACLVASFGCGPWYAICAAACYNNHATCTQCCNIDPCQYCG